MNLVAKSAYISTNYTSLEHWKVLALAGTMQYIGEGRYPDYTKGGGRERECRVHWGYSVHWGTIMNVRLSDVVYRMHDRIQSPSQDFS